jgi:hypothetical protein
MVQGVSFEGRILDCGSEIWDMGCEICDFIAAGFYPTSHISYLTSFGLSEYSSYRHFRYLIGVKKPWL